jgi:hypothetical protein
VESGGAVPQRPHRGQVFVGARASFGHRHPQRRQLRFHVAGADTDGQTPCGQHVERRQLLGQQHRMPLRQNQQAEREPDAAGGGGQERQGHQGFQPRVVTWTRRQGDVVADPQPLEAGLLGRTSPTRQCLRPVGVTMQPVQRELHLAGHSPPPSPIVLVPHARRLDAPPSGRYAPAASWPAQPAERRRSAQGTARETRASAALRAGRATMRGAALPDLPRCVGDADHARIVAAV